jgi:hypothetical protein
VNRNDALHSLENLLRIRRLLSAAPNIFAVLVLLFVASNSARPAWAQETLGIPLPASGTTTITQGGPPNFADTYITPFVATQSRSIFSWKAQFDGGFLSNGGCAIPIGIQLKVLRSVPNTTQVQVINAGPVHNPLTMLQARFGGSCPSFLVDSEQAVLEFTESGLTLSPGDIVGLTIMSDPNSQGYVYPLVTSGASTRLVLRNVAVGDSVDLADSFTATLTNEVPAFFASLGIEVAIDIKPGSYPNSINLSSAGVIPVAIFSTSTFDATTIDPDTLFLAGAAVGMVGKSGKLLCSAQDVNGDGLADLVCQFETAQLLLQPGDTIAVLVGKTFGGVAIRGQDSVNIVPD